MSHPNLCVTLFCGACAFLVSACSFPPLDLSTKRCDCAPGWVCDDVRNVCVETSAQDVPSLPDSGLDVNVVDAGTDAPSIDGSSDGSSDSIAPSDIALDVGNDTAGPDLCTVHIAALVCEDFEDALIGWLEEEDMAIGERSSDEAFGGTSSYHSLSETMNGTAYASRRSLGDITTGDIYIRHRFLLPSVSNLMTFFQIGAQDEPYETITASNVGGFYHMYLTHLSLDVETVNPIIPGAWNCVSVHILVDDTAGTLEFSLNGGTEASVTGIDTRPLAGYQSAEVGLTYTLPDEVGGETYIDDLVIDTNPLPCE